MGETDFFATTGADAPRVKTSTFVIIFLESTREFPEITTSSECWC